MGNTESILDATSAHQADRDKDSGLLDQFLKDFNPESRKAALETKQEDGNDFATRLIIAARDGKLGFVKVLLRYEANIEARGTIKIDGEVILDCTALWIAAAKGHFDVVRLLIKQNAEVDCRISSNSTPLRAAAFGGYLDIVRCLVENGADVNAHACGNSTPLMTTCHSGHLDVASYLLKHGAHINLQDNDERSCLHYASKQGHVQLVCELLASGAKQTRNLNRLTPLLEASNNCKIEMVEWFINRSECSKEQRIDALELLGATIANDPHAYDIEKAFSFMKRGMEERYEDPSCPLLKKKMEPVEAYQNRTESQTLEELSLLEGDNHALHMEGLMIRERILGTDNTILRFPICYRGAVLCYSNKYELCFGLWTRAMEIAMNCNVPKTEDIEDLRSQTDEARGILSAKGGLGAMNIEARKTEVNRSGVGEGRGGRFVPGTEKDLTENFKRETKKISGLFRELTQHLENVQEQPRNRDEELREMTQQLTDVRRQLQERDGELSERTRQLTNTQGQLKERDGQLREKTQQLTDTQGQLKDKDKRLRQKTQQLTNVQGQLQEKDGQLREKTQQLASVVWQLQERDGQLRQKRNQLTDFRRQLQERDEQLRQKRNQLKDVRRQLHETNEEFTSLEHEIDELETSLSAAQRALNERSRPQTPDWVIPRDQIQLTDKCLGKGGWGSVIEGKYCGCAVAVKQMYELILSDHNRRLFEREMSIAARCRHPCMLQFIGATNDEESPLFVTELMQSSLRALLEQRRLSSLEVCVISLDVARALNYLHSQKPSPIIHRDISSANVLLWRQADQWRGKVSDYGTANVLQQTMTVSPGAMIYSAPEAHTRYQTVKVDVYSFGVLLCEICIWELPDPYRRDEQVAMVTNRVLRDLIRRCLQQDANVRPRMEDIIGELEQLM